MPEEDEIEGIVLFRLSRVEESLVKLAEKLDDTIELRTQIATMGVLIEGLVKSRDRLMGGLCVVGTTTLMMIVEQVFNVV